MRYLIGYSIGLLLLLSLSATGCRYRIHDEVAGSGNRIRQKREIAPFTSLSMQGAFDVEIVCQKDVSFEIEGDDNIVPLITTTLTNNVLYIKAAQSYSVHDPVMVKISVPNLEGLSVAGAGKFDISGLKNDKFEIDCSGAPFIRVSGETKVIDIDSNGAAKVDTHKLRAERAVVDSKGVSKIDIAVADQLDVTISGPSQVTYTGDPKVTKKINGPGKLAQKASDGA
ncbi:MAG: GIN domain-containing protein [Pyrinomonadaceae bacterium]